MTQFDAEMAAPVQIEDPIADTGAELHKRVRMEAGRFRRLCGLGKLTGYRPSSWPAAARNQRIFDSPFPFPLKGKAGAGGFPPRRKNGGSPRKRASPLARSPKKDRVNERFLLTEGGLLMEAASVNERHPMPTLSHFQRA